MLGLFGWDGQPDPYALSGPGASPATEGVVSPIPVLFLDANEAFRWLAVRALGRHFAADITLLAEGAAWPLDAPPAAQPQAVLLGLGADGLVEPTLLAAIKAALPGVPVVVLGHLDEPAYGAAALAAGAAAFIAKGDLTTELIPLLRQLVGQASPLQAFR